MTQVVRYMDKNKLDLFNCKQAELKRYYKVIGVGTSRVVYDIGDNKVLKVAKKTQRGEEQSYQEISVTRDFEQFGYGGYVCKIYVYSNDYDRCISEKLIKLTSPKQSFAGIKDSEKILAHVPKLKKKLIACEQVLNEQIYGKNRRGVYSHKEIELSGSERKRLQDSQLCCFLHEAVSSFGLAMGDIVRHDAWGWSTINRRFQLMDVGLTERIYNEQYVKKSRRPVY